jgi:hypothetical protein
MVLGVTLEILQGLPNELFASSLGKAGQLYDSNAKPLFLVHISSLPPHIPAHHIPRIRCFQQNAIGMDDLKSMYSRSRSSRPCQAKPCPLGTSPKFNALRNLEMGHAMSLARDGLLRFRTVLLGCARIWDSSGTFCIRTNTYCEADGSGSEVDYGMQACIE